MEHDRGHEDIDQHEFAGIHRKVLPVIAASFAAAEARISAQATTLIAACQLLTWRQNGLFRRDTADRRATEVRQDCPEAIIRWGNKAVIASEARRALNFNPVAQRCRIDDGHRAGSGIVQIDNGWNSRPDCIKRERRHG